MSFFKLASSVSLSALSVVGLISSVSCYASGAGTCIASVSSVGSMPGSVNAVTGFSLTSAVTSYAPGNKVPVTITSTSPGALFSGFLIYATTSEGAKVGTWTPDTNASPSWQVGSSMSCPTDTSVITHTSATPKVAGGSGATYTWLSPATAQGLVTFNLVVMSANEQYQVNYAALHLNGTAPAAPTSSPTSLPVVSNLYSFSHCPEAISVPALHVIVANSGTLVFGVVISWFLPGMSMTAYVTHIVSFLYIEVSMAYFTVKDYMYWSASPDWSSMMRCELNREFNELILIKGMFRLQLATRLLVLLRVNQDVFGGGDFKFKLVNFILNLLSVLYLPAVLVRSVLLFVSSIAYAWPYAYLTMFSLPAVIILGAYMQSQTGTHVAVLEAYCKESRENRKLSTDAPGDVELNSSLLPSDLRSRLAAVVFALERLADLHLRYQIVTSVLGVIGIYSSIVAFDYQFGNNGVGYTEAFTYFATFRPAFVAYYQTEFDVYKALMYS